MAELSQVVKGRAGWRLESDDTAVYRRGAGRVRRTRSLRARDAWHAVVIEDGTAVQTLSAYTAAEAVKWVERHA